MSTIQIQCINKTLTIIDSPSIEIGGVNSLQFSFCSLWDGYDKTVHFYKNDTTCYPVAITDNVAVVPSDLISEGASFYFFIEGIDYNENKRRSQVFKCKVESSLLVVENPDSDVQARLIEVVEDWYSKDFDYSKLTDEEKAEIKQDMITVNTQYSKYYNVTAEKSKFPIDISRYAHGIDILEVYINGMRLVKDVDYTNDGQNIILTKPLNVIGQLEIVVDKGISATTASLESLKSDVKEGLSAFNRKLSYTVALKGGDTSFTIPDDNFNKDYDILRLHLNGIYYHEGTDYTISGTMVNFNVPVANDSTAEIDITRAVTIDNKDYSYLKGDKGDTGASGVMTSTQGQPTFSVEDGDLYAYIPKNSVCPYEIDGNGNLIMTVVRSV